MGNDPGHVTKLEVTVEGEGDHRGMLGLDMQFRRAIPRSEQTCGSARKMQPLNSSRNWFNGPRRILQWAARFVMHRAITSAWSWFERFQIEEERRADEAIESEK